MCSTSYKSNDWYCQSEMCQLWTICSNFSEKLPMLLLFWRYSFYEKKRTHHIRYTAREFFRVSFSLELCFSTGYQLCIGKIQTRFHFRSWIILSHHRMRRGCSFSVRYHMWKKTNVRNHWRSRSSCNFRTVQSRFTMWSWNKEKTVGQYSGKVSHN